MGQVESRIRQEDIQIRDVFLRRLVRLHFGPTFGPEGTAPFKVGRLEVLLVFRVGGVSHGDFGQDERHGRETDGETDGGN